MISLKMQQNKKSSFVAFPLEKGLKKFSFGGLFGSTEKYENAIELYERAGAQFKIAQDWDAAGDAYIQAAGNAEKAGEGHTAVAKYVDAAKAYKQGNKTEAIKSYDIAVQMHMDNNKFNQAAKLYKEMGILHVQTMDNQKAIKAYKSAADCWKGEDSMAHCNQMLLKVAELSAADMDYKQAINLWEEVAKTSVESALMRHSVKDYLMHAGLCHMALGSKKDDMSVAMDTLEKYKDLHPAFEGSRECKLLEACCQAFEDNNVDQFTETVYKYDQIYKLSNLQADLLLMVKQALKSEGATCGDEVPVDAGDDDLGLGGGDDDDLALG